MTRYQKIGTIIGGIIALMVMITIRSRYGYYWWVKLLGLSLLYAGYCIGGFIDKMNKMGK